MPLVMLKGDARARQKPCLRCGYSLRHNVDARNCPECGLAVRISLRGDDTLELSNPAWLRVVAVATALLALAHLVAAAALALIHWHYVLSLRDDTPVRLFRAVALGRTETVLGVAVLIQSVGALALSAPERRYPERARRRRISLRVFGVLGIGVGLLTVIEAATRYVLLDLPALLLAVVPVATSAAAWGYLHELARRLPARRLMRLTRMLGFAVAIGLACVFFRNGSIALIYMQVYPWEWTALPWTIASLVYVPLATAVLVYCWRQFRAAARQAEANWVTDPR